MKNLPRLFAGETKRLVSYKILPVGLATSLLWVVVFLFLSKADARSIAPLLIYVDITIMAVLLVGASNHLERQDGTIRTMLVLPVSLGEILSAKVLASMVLGLQSALIASAALFLIHGITYNYAWLLLFVLLSGVAHAAIGFLLTLHSKDFSSMLLLLMAYMMLFNAPSILFFFGVIDGKYDWLLMISPSHVSNLLISSCVSGSYDWGKTAAGCTWLAVLSAALLRFAVYPRFRRNAVRG